jgi:hypothetical protein
MIHAKYLTSILCQFREDDCLSFTIYTKGKPMNPRAGLILMLEAKFEQIW